MKRPEEQAKVADRNTFNRWGLLIYFLATFSIRWLCLGVVVLDAKHVISLGSPLLNLGLKGLGNFGPTLSAIGITAYLFGSPGVRSLLARGCDWKLHMSWYVIALFLPFLTVIAGVELAYILNGTTASLWIFVAPTFLGLLGVLVAPLGEELGWRGFALPRLQTQFGFLWASLFLGIIWGFWHLPFFFLPNSSESTLPFLLFLGGCIAETIIYTWLFYHTGSVLICIIFHAATNLALQVVPVFPDMQAGNLLPPGSNDQNL